MRILPIFHVSLYHRGDACSCSDRKLTESGSAKLFVKGNGDTEVKDRGILTDKELHTIQQFIKENYKEMYLKWASMSPNGFYNGI